MRIALLARHYPPAISGGARRPFLLMQSLRSMEHETFVIAPALPETEPGLCVSHPHRDPAAGPTAATGMSASARALARDLLLWPDPDIGWCKRAAKAARAQLPWKPDWVMSTSPPESVHVAGRMVARRTGARWYADFRDTWLERPHRLERKRFHRRIGETLLAGSLLRSADVVTAVDPVVAAEIRRLGARDVDILAHFAPDQMPAAMPMPSDRINILHAGSIELSDPEARIEEILAPFGEASARNPTLHLHFVGRLTAREQNAILDHGLRARITEHGPVPYDQSLSMIAGADALVFVASGKMHVPPSKIVEYLATDAPIVACGAGPWRTDPRVPQGAAGLAMQNLRKGQARDDILPSPPRAADAAHRLEALLGRKG